jgi:sulfite reductase (ferredoxin)
MSHTTEPILNIPEAVREDVLAYRAKVAAFRRGESNPTAFKAYRVPMGIYEHRTDGRYMVRVRLGAGLVLPHQLERIAALSRAHGNGVLHVTTRQDIQIHDVDIDSTPDVLEGLLDAGISSRGGGGNTVRNVSACPRAGRCPHERFNVAPHSISVAEYLLQHRSSFNLPRKYKIAFSGCGTDCALASVTDLGFFAQTRGGVPGFRVYAGGGLGGSPRGGVVIEEFVPVDEAVEVAEAIRRVFDKNGDRTNKNRARLRYVLNRLGDDQFKRLYQEERDALRAEGLSGHPPVVKDMDARFGHQAPGPSESADQAPTELSHLLWPEKTPGRVTLRLPLPLGDIPADDLVAVARLAEDHGAGLVGATQEQELLVYGVRRAALPAALELLREMSAFASLLKSRPRVVACAGASTCKLGLCLSRGLASAISAEFDAQDVSGGEKAPVIRISGCPNSCGGHHIGAIGLEGRAQRHNGRLLPVYVVLAGGVVSEDGASLAKPLGTVPARQIPLLLAAAYKEGATGTEGLRDVVARYTVIPDTLPEEFYYDFGADTPFSLAGRGPGECGAGVFDVIQLDIREAGSAIKSANTVLDDRVRSEELYRALLASARSLLVIFGLEVSKEHLVFEAFDRELITPGWVSTEARSAVSDALDWRLGGDTKSLVLHAETIGAVVARITDLFASLDANLKFRLTPLAPEPSPAAAVDPDQAVARADLSGVLCPMNFVKAKVALEKIPVGAVLEVVLDNGEPIQNVPASLAEQGHEVLSVTPLEGRHLLRVRRKK